MNVLHTIISHVRGGGSGRGATVMRIVEPTEPGEVARRVRLDPDCHLSGSGRSGTLKFEITLPGIYAYESVQGGPDVASIGDLDTGFIRIGDDGTVTKIRRDDVVWVMPSPVDTLMADLPPLSGSPKQVEWALEIRRMHARLRELDPRHDPQQFAERLEMRIRHVDLARSIAAAAIHAPDLYIRAVDEIMSNPAAKWWIDNRQTVAERLSDLMEKLVANSAASEDDRERERLLQLDAEAEATLRPPAPITAAVTVIDESDGRIIVALPHKREDFRLLMRANGFSWTGSAWSASYNLIGGDVHDRIAEYASIVLAANFPVRVMDHVARERLVSGSFARENRRTVKAEIERRRFSIRWPRENDHYKLAIKISGARYDMHHVTAPASSFEEVEDFAERHDFVVSDAARKIIDEERAALARGLIVQVSKPEVVSVADRSPLAPADGRIDDALRDDD